MNLHWARLLCVLLSTIWIAGCANDGSNPAHQLPTTTMQIGNKTFTLEIANTDQTKEHGLMERDSMPADHGMIFVFGSPTSNPFWMYHTRFPLDIIFIDSDARVIAIKPMKAYDTTPVGSPRPYRWAIELNLGAAGTAGLKPGMTLRIPPDAMNSKN